MDSAVTVLDTSVVVKWFFTDEPLRREALAVRQAVADDPRRFVVPHLFYSELIHVLARKSGSDTDFVKRALDLVMRLGLATLGLSEQGFASCSTWCCKGLSGYDATFVALASECDGIWLTADERAARVVSPDLLGNLSDWTS
ncbi:MAG: type II toxin-antitoxin system VapC family toxin [Deltaproteobacteria bacterium]|nr:type II toxin-antitoxin system VapC family toxin [Deltaproteobacteria bacterium]